MTEVKTYSHVDPAFHEAGSTLLELGKQITDDRLAENYTAKRMKLDDTVGISIYYEGSTPVGFSTILNIPLFNNSVRILNRFYKIPSHRDNHRRVTDGTKAMVNQQIELSKSLGFSYAFMSREGVSPPAMRHYTRQLDQDWVVLNDRFQVCPANCASCYQRVAYHSLDGGNDLGEQLYTSITEDQFKERFGDELSRG